MAYCVTNKTPRNIFVKDGGWNSKEIKPDEQLNIVSSRDVNVTIYTKIGGQDDELGKAWVRSTGSITVHGVWHWDIHNSNNCKSIVTTEDPQDAVRKG